MISPIRFDHVRGSASAVPRYLGLGQGAGGVNGAAIRSGKVSRASPISDKPEFKFSALSWENMVSEARHAPYLHDQRRPDRGVRA